MGGPHGDEMWHGMQSQLPLSCGLGLVLGIASCRVTTQAHMCSGLGQVKNAISHKDSDSGSC